MERAEWGWRCDGSMERAWSRTMNLRGYYSILSYYRKYISFRQFVNMMRCNIRGYRLENLHTIIRAWPLAQWFGCVDTYSQARKNYSRKNDYNLPEAYPEKFSEGRTLTYNFVGGTTRLKNLVFFTEAIFFWAENLSDLYGNTPPVVLIGATGAKNVHLFLFRTEYEFGEASEHSE